MSATASVDSAAPSLAAAVQRLPAWLRSEAVVLALMVLALGLYYFTGGLSTAVVGVGAFFLLTLYRPDLSLAMVPLAAPLFYRQRPIPVPFVARETGVWLSLAEIIILSGVAAWVMRDGWALLRTHRLPWLREMLANRAVWLAGAFLVVGVLWLFVPPTGDLKRVAFREWRVTVLEPAMFFLLILRWLRSERDLWRMAAAWLVMAAFIGREGVEQFLFGQAALMEGVGRATSVYPSATAFGIYAGRALPLAVVLCVMLPREWKLWKLATALLAVPIGLGVLFSFARGAWIGDFVALLAVAVVARHKWLLGGLAAITAAGLAALPFIKIERITSMFNFATEDNTGVARAKIWTAALRIIRDHPILGIGQDQFLYQDPKYGVPQMRFFTTSHPHNWVLDFWLRLGLPGLLWIIGTLVYFFWQTLRLWRRWKGNALGVLALALGASMIDFVVHGLLDMAYFTMDLALTFWLTLGLVVVMMRLGASDVVRPAHDVPA